MRPGYLTLSDLATLYPELAPSLRRVLAKAVDAPASIQEEACQLAWGQLVSHRAEVDEQHALSWLATTARRAAVQMLRECNRCVSIDAEENLALVASLPVLAATENLCEYRRRLDQVRRLPIRQQRMVWLQVVGYDYPEIASRTGDSERTVERQLGRARQALQALERTDAA
jgi:RNA polymerase sigma factor (sigma-70 family)